MTARMVLCETPRKGFLIRFPQGHKGVQVAGSNRWERAPPPSVSRYCRLRCQPARAGHTRPHAQAGARGSIHATTGAQPPSPASA